MPPIVLPVLWKDSHRRGLRGVVEFRETDLPQKHFHDARISDVIEVLNMKVRGVSRAVEAVFLYGTRLSTDRRLETIIPDLVGSSPRLIATMQVPPDEVPDVVVITETLTNKKTRIPWKPRDTVAAMKLWIQDVEDIPADTQILAFNSTRLDDRTLESYKIRRRSLIYMTLILNGGCIPPRSTTGVPTNIPTRQYFNNAPRWRIAYEGLNIEGKCKTRSCPAFRQMIIYPYQFESFNLVLERCIWCSICHVLVEPLACAFYNCAWKFEGIRALDGLSISSQWKDASGDRYHYLSAGASCIQWKSLLIVVKSRRTSNTAKLVASPEFSEIAKDEICTICWTTFWLITIATAPCGHKFHRCCFNKWSQWCSSHDSQPSCPVCRKPVRVPVTPVQ